MRAEGRQWSPGRWRGWAGPRWRCRQDAATSSTSTGQLGSCFHPVSHFSQQAINMHNINSLIMDKKCSKHVSCKEARSILLVTPDNKNLEPCPRAGPERPARTGSWLQGDNRISSGLCSGEFCRVLYFDIDTVIIPQYYFICYYLNILSYFC